MERQNKEAMQRQQDIQRRNQIREERKRNITFRYLGAKVKNGETLDSYETVDQNTGEEILISNVRKIGKDEQSNYLYTANMQLLEDMAYRMQDDLGYAVVFSTAYKLDQIEQMQDPQLIQKISKLLSVDNLSAEERVYLGQLNAQGEVTRKLEETSNSIQYNVKQMQQQYRNEHQRGGWEL